MSIHRFVKCLYVLFLFFFTVSTIHADTVFVDNFNRADSQSLGNGWIEFGEYTDVYHSTTTNMDYAPYYIELKNDSAVFTCKEISPNNIATRNVIMASSNLGKNISAPFELSFVYSPDVGERVHHEIGLIDSLKGYYVNGDNDDVDTRLPINGVMLGIYKSDSILNNSTVKFIIYDDGIRREYKFANKIPFQFDYGRKYEFTLNVHENGNIAVSVSNGVQKYNDGIVVPKEFILGLYDSVLINPTEGCAGYGYISPSVEIFFDDIVVNTNTPPVIVLQGDDPLEISVGEEYVEPGFEAEDKEDGDITDSVTVDDSEVDTSVSGEYFVYYSVEDSGGLTATSSRKVIVKEDEKTSVAFFPGIMGSRLYTMKLKRKKNEEIRLWESGEWKKLKKLSMNENGETKNKKIYTKDVIKTFRPFTGLPFKIEGYKGWIDFMDGLVAGDVIYTWEPIPYDWRLATDEVVRCGYNYKYNKISYSYCNEEMPYIVQELAALASMASNDKVTIIAHSNGGLVVKNLLIYLKDTGDKYNLLPRIENIVFVAVPQLGTPKTLGSLLHGTIPTALATSRELVEDMPGVYGLIPSEKLFPLLETPIIEFAESISNLPAYKKLANKKITTYEDFKKFLLGEYGSRSEPGMHNLSTPNVLNKTLLNEAKTMHDELDSLIAENSIHTTEIVGIGIDTPTGIIYGDCGLHNCPATQNYLAHEWKMSPKGDGTVLASSAGNVWADDTYYFAMDEYNKGKKRTYSHSTILSAYPVQDFILNNVLKRRENLPIFMGEDPERTSEYPHFEIKAYSPIDIHLYAKDVHTGVVGKEVKKMGRPYEENVPNSYYEEWGNVKYVGGTLSEEGLYLKIVGTKDGVFTLDLSTIDRNYEKDGEYIFKNIPVTSGSVGIIELNEGEDFVLLYDYDGDGEIDANLKPGDTFDVSEMVDFDYFKKKVKETKMSKWFKKWILVRIDTAEDLYSEGGKTKTKLAKRILHSINYSLVCQRNNNISKDDAKALLKINRTLIKTL